MPAERGGVRTSAEGESRADGDVPRPSGTALELVLQNPRRYGEAVARRLRPWLTPLVAQVVPSATSLTVRMVSDREMRHLNATYRQRDKSTDVLSFPGDLEGLAEGVAVEAGHLGDIVISVPTARRQAAERGHTVQRELRVLILHGILHCMGYDHTTDNGTMEQLELRLRARWIDHG